MNSNRGCQHVFSASAKASGGGRAEGIVAMCEAPGALLCGCVNVHDVVRLDDSWRPSGGMNAFEVGVDADAVQSASATIDLIGRSTAGCAEASMICACSWRCRNGGCGCRRVRDESRVGLDHLGCSDCATCCRSLAAWWFGLRYMKLAVCRRRSSRRLSSDGDLSRNLLEVNTCRCPPYTT